MAHVVVLGAGLGGAIMAYEMKAQLRQGDTLTVITKDPKYHFVPSNPWVAVGWRTRDAVQVDLAPVFAKKGINFKPVAAKKLLADNNTIELEDGTSVNYDFLIIATGRSWPSMRLRDLAPMASLNPSAILTMPKKQPRLSRRSAKPPAPSSLAPCRAHPVLALPMNSPSFWKPSCAAARSVTAYP
jgi:choline dehydrogenase-like flavoprotein